MTHPLSRDALHKLAVDLHSRILNRQDLLGCSAISYLRFSSTPQELGTSIVRQNEVLDRIVDYFELVRDRQMEDRGFSASKRRHENYGQLGVLLKMVADGEITPSHPVVLIIEATDRLFRSGMFDVFPVLRTLIREGGMIMVTGDMTIWNEAAINSPLVHKLIAELNAARDYATRLGQLARGAHAEKRRMMEALMDDPTAKRPMLAGRPPAWIIREVETGVHRLHPIHAETVRLIFRLYISGHSTNQIAVKLNRDGVPILGDKQRAGHRLLEWRATKISDILRDESVLGLVQPHHTVNSKRVAVGQKVKLYPPAIEAAEWMAAQEMLDARGFALRGRKGNIANLFTGRVVCHCGGTMRVDTGGGETKQRIRKFQCNRYVEGRTCEDSTRYDVPLWEPLIVDKIIERSLLVPRSRGNGHAKTAEDASAAVRLEIQQTKDEVAFLEPRAPKSPTAAERYDQACLRLDALRAREGELVIEAQSTQSSVSRAVEVHRFMQEVRGPALRGDRDARERLRGLLSKIDFKVVFGGTIPGGIDLTIGEWCDTFGDQGG